MPQIGNSRPGNRPRFLATDWNEVVQNTLRNRQRDTTQGDFLKLLRSFPLNIAKVKNDSGEALDQFDAVGLDAPLILPSANLAAFKRQATFSVVLPEAGTHEGRFGILLQPLAAGKIGSCAVAGVSPCGISVADSGDTWADLQTAGQVLAEIDDGEVTLLAGTSGSAQILWAADEDEEGESWRWALVRISGGTASSAKAKKIRFTLASALTTATASVAGCTVRSYFDGTNPGSTVTIYNEPAALTAYMFSGASGNYGLAQWDDVQGKYFIYQLECP